MQFGGVHTTSASQPPPTTPPAPSRSRDWTDGGMDGGMEGRVCRDARFHLSAPLKEGCGEGVEEMAGGPGGRGGYERGNRLEERRRRKEEGGKE